MIDRKEIELLIRSKLQGTAKLADITGTVEKLGTAIDVQAAAAKRGEASIKDLTDAERRLLAVQEQLGAQADAIGAYQRAADAAGKLATRVQATGQAYEAFKTKLAGVGTITDKQQERLIKLSAAHDRAAAAQAKHQARMAALETSLREAGIATDKLADAELRVRTAAALIATSVAKAREAVRGYDADVNNAARSTNTLARASTNLRPPVVSMSEALNGMRLRGLVSQLVALTGAYVGLQGAVNLAGGAVESFSTREAVQNQLALSVGTDRRAIDEEYAYIKGQADRIGTVFESTARGYAKFLASAKTAGRGKEEIRFISESFLELGRVANLTADEMEGVFRALGQSFNIGKIQAEELNQLSERIPGVAAVAQQALKARRTRLQPSKRASPTPSLTSSSLLQMVASLPLSPRCSNDSRTTCAAPRAKSSRATLQPRSPRLPTPSCTCWLISMN